MPTLLNLEEGAPLCPCAHPSHLILAEHSISSYATLPSKGRISILVPPHPTVQLFNIRLCWTKVVTPRSAQNCRRGDLPSHLRPASDRAPAQPPRTVSGNRCWTSQHSTDPLFSLASFSRYRSHDPSPCVASFVLDLHRPQVPHRS